MEDFSPEELQALMALGIMPEELSGLDSQIAQAQALRDSPMPQGQMAGRVHVAPSILQFAATGLDRYRGMKDLKGLQGQRKGLLDKTTDARMLYAEALRKRLSGGMDPAGMQPSGAETFPVR